MSASRLDLAFPADVLGPMDRCALQRFAAICFPVAMSDLLRNLTFLRIDSTQASRSRRSLSDGAPPLEPAPAPVDSRPWVDACATMGPRTSEKEQLS